MAPRLSGQTSIFGAVFFVSKSLLRIERQKKLKKFSFLTRKPRSHVRILNIEREHACKTSAHAQGLYFQNSGCECELHNKNTFFF